MGIPSSFRFECARCGRCCVGRGRVYVYPGDLSGLAGVLRVNRQELIDRYLAYRMEILRFVDGQECNPRLVVRKRGNGACVFLDNRSCSVHSAKPSHCRRAPLIVPILESTQGWAWFSRVCRGLGKGRTYTEEEIREALREDREADAEYWRCLEKDDYRLGEVLGVRLGTPEVLEYAFNCTKTEYYGTGWRG